jgi:RNA polymerase sigma-70 factor (ECF subfamily)
VVQETFVRAYDALGRYQEQNRFGAWLFTILVTECRGALSRRHRRERIFIADPALVAEAESPSKVEAELRDAMEHAIGRLEPLLREAFLLRHVEELSYEEMQMITGAGLSALKMRVKRACEALRAHLGEPV